MEIVAEDGPVAEDVEFTEKLRPVPNTATAYLLSFHKSQCQYSAWLSGVGVAATCWAAAQRSPQTHLFRDAEAASPGRGMTMTSPSFWI